MKIKSDWQTPLLVAKVLFTSLIKGKLNTLYAILHNQVMPNVKGSY